MADETHGQSCATWLCGPPEPSSLPGEGTGKGVAVIADPYYTARQKRAILRIL